MSGGSFDYNCFRISQFAEELKNRIDENDHEDEYGYASRFNKETIEKLNQCQRIIELAGQLAHDIEWLYSGDIGEETFMKRLNEFLSEKDIKDNE
jgi:hypothetical protein